MAKTDWRCSYWGVRAFVFVVGLPTAVYLGWRHGAAPAVVSRLSALARQMTQVSSNFPLHRTVSQPRWLPSGELCRYEHRSGGRPGAAAQWPIGSQLWLCNVANIRGFPLLGVAIPCCSARRGARTVSFRA